MLLPLRRPGPKVAPAPFKTMTTTTPKLNRLESEIASIRTKPGTIAEQVRALESEISRLSASEDDNDLSQAARSQVKLNALQKLHAVTDLDREIHAAENSPRGADAIAELVQHLESKASELRKERHRRACGILSVLAKQSVGGLDAEKIYSAGDSVAEMFADVNDHDRTIAQAKHLAPLVACATPGATWTFRKILSDLAATRSALGV